MLCKVRTNRKLTERWNRRPQLEALEDRLVPSLTPVDPYLVPVAAGVETVALLTVGESVPELDAATDPTPNPLGHRLVGIPDGMGAFDNGDGTFTVLMNHELGGTSGIVRDHGSRGSFVSKFIVNKATLEVLGGDDLIKQTKIWDTATSDYVSLTTVLQRLCSADLAPVSAYFNAASGLGTTARIFMSGEEVSGGRGFAHVVTGPEAGTSYEFARIGNYAFENIVASPLAQDKTIVVGLDDSSRNFSSEGAPNPSEVYVYIGTKQNTGTEVQKAGLTNGLLYGVRVLDGSGNPKANEGTVVNGDRFGLFNLGNVENQNEVTLQAASIANTVTQFRRVEDGQWDPNQPNDFYFVTTDQFNGNSKLWRLRFNDITNPTAGGTIEALVDNSDGVQMLDNMTVDGNGRVLLQEDTGNQAYLAKVWIYDVATDSLTQMAQHNPKFFAPGGSDFFTQDEESSGIISLEHILGEGYYLANVQAHAAHPDPELVERGQLLVLKATGPTAYLNPVGSELVVLGTSRGDELDVKLRGQTTVQVKDDGDVIASFNLGSIASITVSAYGGNDEIYVDSKLTLPAFLRGGAGNDDIRGGSGNDLISGDDGHDEIDGRDGHDVLLGGWGRDELDGGKGDDLLISGYTVYDRNPVALEAIRAVWAGAGSYNTKVANLRAGIGAPALNASTVLDDGVRDVLKGGQGLDWFWGFFNDRGDNKPGEAVN